jgi:SAM-dependent methyltransferase
MAYRNTLTDNQWEKWARENPYFGVLLVETKEVESGAARESFFASGEEHIAAVLHDAEAQFGPVPRGSAVDFGCGVGRLLRPLAREFDRVAGIDVSPTMLELSRRNLEGHAKVDLVRTPQELLDRGERFDFVHSYIVFQHIRPQQGMPLIRQLVELTRPGGLFALHFNIGDGKPVRRVLNQIRYRFKPAHWLYNVARRRKWNESITEMNRYDIGAILRDIAPLVGERTAARYVDQNGHHSVILYGQRRPA